MMLILVIGEGIYTYLIDNWGEPERAPQYRVLCIPTVYVCLFIYMHVRRAVYVSAMRFIPFLRKTQKKDNFKVHVSVIVNSNGSSW